MKKVLIIDNTFDPPHGCPEIQALLKAAAEGGEALEVVACRAPEGLIPSRLEGYSGAVLSGSKTRIEERAPWIEAEMEAIRHLHRLRIPTLGICYGEQLIAKTFGAATGVAQRHEYGWVEIEVEAHSPILEGLPKRFYSFEYHADEVRSLTEAFTPLARSKDCAIQAFQVNEAPMWGIQFHPERGAEHGKRSLERVRARNERVINADREDELFDPRIGETIFRNLVAVIRGRNVSQ